MCVRVSMGCEVCQIWPSSSASAAAADCPCERGAWFMTQGLKHETSRKSYSLARANLMKDVLKTSKMYT